MRCDNCRIGNYQEITTPYIRWANGRQIMIIPNAPAYSCDICGQMEYDPAFIYKLNHLLDRFSEQAHNPGTAYRQSVASAPPSVSVTSR